MTTKSKSKEPRRSREQAGHTQSEAAALLGVHRRSWQNWESGAVPVPAQMLRLYRHLAGLEPIPYAQRKPSATAQGRA